MEAIRRSPVVRVRSDLSLIPPYIRGRAEPQAVRLASNESPHRPPAAVRAAVAEAVGNAHRYPSGGDELAMAIAARLDVTPRQVLLAAGSIAVSEQLLSTVASPGDEIVFSWRSFEAYPVMCAVRGLVATPVALTGQCHDLPAIAAAVTDHTRAIEVCSPNNPTGAVVSASDAATFLDTLPQDVLVVWDEAYREFVTDNDASDGVLLAESYPNVVAVRTFSKAFGLAGLRLGYAVGDAELLDQVRRVQTPFAVSDAAVAAGLTCLQPEVAATIELHVRQVVSERERVSAGLRDLGYRVAASHGNFVWLPLAEPTAWSDGSADLGVLVRGYPDSGVRVTIGTAEDNDRFLGVAAQLPRA